MGVRDHMPFRVAWLTDVHMDCAAPSFRDYLGKKVKAESADVVVVTGDIATSATIRNYLRQLRQDTGLPLYFVLGNHDLWGAKREVTYRIVRENTSPTLVWLQEEGVISLTPKTALVGVDGWYDCRAGDFYESGFSMHDLKAVHDFKDLGKDSSLALMQRMADQGTYKIVDRAEAAVKAGHTHVILATHVPPFEDACLYRGKKTEPLIIPFYCNFRMGEELLKLADRHHQVTFTVLCGHTHGETVYSPRPNLECRVGGSTYLYPQVQKTLEVD